MLIGGWPEVDYRNPQIWYDCFLIFECNVYGNYDIFGVKFDVNGLAGDAFQLTDTEYDENTFFCIGDYLGQCCWESQGSIIAAELQISQDTLKFAELETIDSVNCFEPVCRDNYIAWRKVENNESHIYYSKKNYPDYQWSVPDTIIQTNDNLNLSISNSNGMEGYTICWQASDKIYFTDTWWGYNPQISSPEIPGIEKYYEPTAFNIDMILDELPNLYSFSGQTATSRDIYVADEFFSVYVLNITNDSLVNKNPMLFFGRVVWPNFEVINIWQTEIDGNDVLYMSSAWYLATAGVDEGELVDLNISPNPVGENQNITINSPENIFIKDVQVFSCTGYVVQEKVFNSQSHQFEIDLNNALPGVYFIKIQTSRGETVREIIKL